MFISSFFVAWCFAQMYLCYINDKLDVSMLRVINLFSDLMTVLDRNVDELSGGELQRFACAVVCIQKADM